MYFYKCQIYKPQSAVINQKNHPCIITKEKPTQPTMEDSIPNFNIEETDFNPDITITDKNKERPVVDIGPVSNQIGGVDVILPDAKKPVEVIKSNKTNQQIPQESYSETKEAAALSDISSVLSDFGPSASVTSDPVDNNILEGLDTIANPIKTKTTPKQTDDQSYEVETVKSGISDAFSSIIDESPAPDYNTGGGTGGGYGGYGSRMETPEEKFVREENEKQEYLIKLMALESKGVRLSREFSMKSKLEDIKFEYEKQKNLQERIQSVDFMKNLLVTFTNGIEILNDKYDPIGAKLNGWSETVIENMGSYESIFEKLHEKYKGTVELAPELELLMTLVSSMFMYHMMQTMFKTAIPNLGQTMAQNPVLMKEMARAVGQAADKTAGQQSAQQQGIPQAANEMPGGNGGFDISSLLGGLMGGLGGAGGMGGMGGMPMPNFAQGPPPPQNTRRPRTTGQTSKNKSSANYNDPDEVNSRLTDMSGDSDNSSVRISKKRNSNKRRIVL